jgi:hypothetical protein
MSDWPFPTCADGSPLETLDALGQGVKGYAIEVDGYAYIPLIEADREGSGDVGRWLDALPPKVRITNCISIRLWGMLERRGWSAHIEDGCDVWEKIT